MKRIKPWWIKERYNPQLDTYYVACGQMTVKEAKSYEKPGYGYNTMHRFDTEDDYLKQLEELKAQGEKVQ